MFSLLGGQSSGAGYSDDSDLEVPNEKLAFRVLFVTAAIYNLAFAAWSGLAADQFFAMVSAPVPAGWHFVAPIVAIFGFCYAYAAWQPERGDVAVGIGLASKVAGPLLWLAAVTIGDSTPRLFPLLLVGDLIWWLPFVVYLSRRSAYRVASLMAWCFAIHVVANVCLLLASGGTELVAEFADRQAFVLRWTPLWVATWFAWALSSISLFGFCAAWAAKIHQPRATLAIAITVVGVGVGFDLYGETLLITQATRVQSLADFTAVLREYQFVGPGVANGLYCVGGTLLSIASWRAGFLRGSVGILGFLVWAVGFGLTAAAFADQRLAMIACGGGVMVFFLSWSALVAVIMLRTAQGNSTENPSACSEANNSLAPRKS